LGVVDELKSWWEIVQIGGAGAALVLGPMYFFLWKAREDDLKYIREGEKNTLRVLSELTTVMQTGDKDGERRHVELERAIKHSEESIKNHIDKASNNAH
jgi:hypothetical protein